MGGSLEFVVDIQGSDSFPSYSNAFPAIFFPFVKVEYFFQGC